MNTIATRKGVAKAPQSLLPVICCAIVWMHNFAVKGRGSVNPWSTCNSRAISRASSYAMLVLFE